MICMKSALQQKASQNKRKKLDIPWNNAGIGGLSSDTVTKQGIEGHIGVNGVGTLHFTQLLYEKLRAATTSNGEKKNRVRIVWTTSWMGEGRSPKGGYRMEDLERGGTGDGYVDYAVLKTASWMLAYEAGRRWDAEGILSIVQNPDNLNTQAYRTQGALMMFFVNKILYSAKHGAYTELFAGLSRDLTEEHQEKYIIPWGRI